MNARHALLAIALLVPSASLVQAAPPDEITVIEREGGQLPVRDILGTPVRTPAGEALGTIADLLVDPDSGRVEYFALQPAGPERDRLLYPVAALVAGERPGDVLLHPDFDSASAGATRLPPRLLHARDLGNPEELVADLDRGTLLRSPAGDGR